MKPTTDFLRDRSSGFYAALSLLMIALIGMIDFNAPADLNVVLLYFIPILFAEIRIGSQTGLLVSLLSAMCWAITNGPLAGATSTMWVHTLNILSTFFIFLSGNGVMALFRAAGERETAASRTDRLSGLLNRLGFVEVLHREVARSRRHKKVFSIVCFNADHFKGINAEHGHETGDHAIELIGRALQQGMRSSDIVARLESDEFMALLPEMDAETARMALNRIQRLLNEAMKVREWNITFRAGSATFLKAPDSSEELLRLAERLQYVVRAAPKGSIKQQTID